MLLEACEWSFAGCICNTCFTRLGKQFFQKDDIESLRRLADKFGPLSKLINKVLNFIEKVEFKE